MQGNIRRMQPIRIAPEFKVWRVTPHGNIPIETTGETLADVVNEAQLSCYHKDQLIVLATDGKGSIAHFHQIKQGKREYRRNPLTGEPGFVAPLYAAPLFQMAVHDFAPVEPWCWSPDADVVGAQIAAIGGDA